MIIILSGMMRTAVALLVSCLTAAGASAAETIAFPDGVALLGEVKQTILPDGTYPGTADGKRCEFTVAWSKEKGSDLATVKTSLVFNESKKPLTFVAEIRPADELALSLHRYKDEGVDQYDLRQTRKKNGKLFVTVFRIRNKTNALQSFDLFSSIESEGFKGLPEPQFNCQY